MNEGIEPYYRQRMRQAGLYSAPDDCQLCAFEARWGHWNCRECGKILDRAAILSHIRDFVSTIEGDDLERDEVLSMLDALLSEKPEAKRPILNQ